MVTEIRKEVMSGYIMLLVLPVALIVLGYAIFNAILSASIALLIVESLLLIVVVVLLTGFFMVHPNEAKVLQLFGQYVGTAREPGLRWANPFYSKVAVSVRVRNFESGMLKVNDSAGNPIEIATVVVWRVVDTAEAVFEVDDYESFVHIQAEAALRILASVFPYEAHGGEEVALRSSPTLVAERLKSEVQERLDKAGVEVIEARISHLAYAQ